MNIGHYFIDRPRSAAVIAIFIVIVGVIAYAALPVSQYPEISPPTIVVRAVYPGATAEVVAQTVATPIEQEVNGVERMLYLTSQSTSDGVMSLSVVFEIGTDLDTAQVQVQNRISVAEPRLPEEVRRIGVTTAKSSPDLMMVVHLESPDGTYDDLYISNYALLQVRDVLARIDGVGNLTVFGAREYSMRVWLDPDRLAFVNLTAGDVIRALRAQNVQVAGGTLGQPPMTSSTAFQVAVNTQGRFIAAEEFENVIVKSDANSIVRIKDVGRVELGARDYVTNSYLDGKPAIAIAIFQRPGSNALATSDDIQRTMAELAENFPAGLAYRIVYNPTDFIQQSVDAVYSTIVEAVVLVILVIVLFLQSWRAAAIPIVAIPVSLIGTFAVMAALGFSLNNLTLFGLVLAIGIVVDDAIVVVENIERNLKNGLSAREASRVTMTEVGPALVSIALVLSAVFVPTAFLGGISGEFFRQFALTIAVATVISAFISLTLSPALGAILLRHGTSGGAGFGRVGDRLLEPIFRRFNSGFDKLSSGYADAVCRVARRPAVSLVVFVVLLALTAFAFQSVPRGFIPQQDQGYAIVIIELPKGASLERTDAVVRRASEIVLRTPGAYRSIAFSGFSAATFANASNAGAIFVGLKPFAERTGETAAGVVQQLWGSLAEIQDAQILVVEPPPVRGIGNAGGFKMMLQDRAGRGLKVLEQSTMEIVDAGNRSGLVQQAYSTFSTTTPQYYLDIDRTKAQMLNVPVESIFETLQVYLGSTYVNDFNLFGRSYRVTAQADGPFRFDPTDIARLRTRSSTGAMVPLGSVLAIRNTTGTDRVVRHNLYTATEIQGSAAAGVSSDDALTAMESLAARLLPSGLSFEWSELAFQQRLAGGSGLLIFPLSVLFIFLLLTFQYESWSLPFAIIAIVPLCILFALAGVWLRGLDNNILTQIGFVVLIGLASKNAILIVEFAKQREDAGEDRFNAVTHAAQLRLRPILMTSFAFILGVVPLVLASGAGAEMRQSLGTAVFSGMIGVTIIGLFLTPVFYVVIRTIVNRRKADAPIPSRPPAT
jgi:hydrophobic/amphiphilic exporter-1 (mainly G- bacteria), HAE1 family